MLSSLVSAKLSVYIPESGTYGRRIPDISGAHYRDTDLPMSAARCLIAYGHRSLGVVDLVAEMSSCPSIAEIFGQACHMIQTRPGGGLAVFERAKSTVFLKNQMTLVLQMTMFPQHDVFETTSAEAVPEPARRVPRSRQDHRCSRVNVQGNQPAPKHELHHAVPEFPRPRCGATAKEEPSETV